MHDIVDPPVLSVRDEAIVKAICGVCTVVVSASTSKTQENREVAAIRRLLKAAGVDDVSPAGGASNDGGAADTGGTPGEAGAPSEAGAPGGAGAPSAGAGGASDVEGSGCGDGQLQPGEACDDGNDASGDGCSAACQWDVAEVAAGEFHTCARRGDGAIKCWGANTYGQLGLGDTDSRGGMPNQMASNLPALDLCQARFVDSTRTLPAVA